MFFEVESIRVTPDGTEIMRTLPNAKYPTIPLAANRFAEERTNLAYPGDGVRINKGDGARFREIVRSQLDAAPLKESAE